MSTYSDSNGAYFLDTGSPFVEHHGILGMKWGIRRYQNEDGSLTPAGRERYYGTDGGLTKKGKKLLKKETKKLKQLHKDADLDYQKKKEKLHALADVGYRVKHDYNPPERGLHGKKRDSDYYFRVDNSTALHRARYLRTVEGHEEAVAKYNAQIAKMSKTFGKKAVKDISASFDKKKLERDVKRLSNKKGR